MQTASATSEVAAALLLALITVALSALSAFLYQRYRKTYFIWWSVGWGLYGLRIAAIITFLETENWRWLYLHQVVTGWTALALLGAALTFAQPRRLDPRWLAAGVLFPVAWAWVAIYQLESFTLAATATVVLMALATGWTGLTFLRYRRRTGSGAALLVGAAFLLWGVHHLDYPLLRARGLLTPWSYYLDTAFILVTGIGVLLLVLEDQGRGLRTLAALSGELQRGAAREEALDALLDRPLGLAGVRGSAMYRVGEGARSGRFVRGAGVAGGWAGHAPAGEMARVIATVMAEGKPAFTATAAAPTGGGAPFPFTAVLPVIRGAAVRNALVIVGSTSDPFTALDESFLVALGQQVGAALENEELYQRLTLRTLELEQLSLRMIQQHEEQRRRLSLELHDETAQVFSAVKIQLGMIRENAAPAEAERLGKIVALVDEGMRSIRRVTEDLRPSLLDDLGLVPALRALAQACEARTGMAVSFSHVPIRKRLGEEGELALFRGLQEALSNAVRHAGATALAVQVGVDGERVSLTVEDNGVGLPADFALDALSRVGHMGLAGMHERIAALGGEVRMERGERGGLRLVLLVPTREEAE